MKALHIIKIGGDIVEDAEKLENFLAEFEKDTNHKILVHGGGKAASDMCEKLGIPIRMSEGRRITDKETLDVAVMVYAGLINKKIVAKLQARSLNALGICGADLNIIPADKREVSDINYGFVGDIKSGDINTRFLERLLDEQIVPVIPAITHNGRGQLLNTNADTIAATLAGVLSDKYETKLSYCLGKTGVLENNEDDETVISNLSKATFNNLRKKGIINEGMIPKLETAFGALQSDVKTVQITHPSNLNNQTGTRLNP